ncbi:MAG TPA: HprK-related kinase B [Humidesulfovibrio sp.]|uniref:HprK-related kinase B n=1 Tax=Humidesulfovibrio sp. TaxID=2910988 RepID=UPI002C2BA579|nr:HprK-related kinase B [Humidesulfovibrio sp.]HWR03018.1 HprK-related kinase B [Humidesulfovibrio sp.]
MSPAEPPRFEALAGAYAARAAAPFALALRLEELTLSLRSNSLAVIEDLRAYFAPFVTQDAAPADLDFLFLDGPVEEPPVPLATRPHLPGKKPDKERTAELPGTHCGGRLVRKQATGMLFLFGGGTDTAARNSAAPNIAAPNIAVGPCAANRNQLVNFLCARYMERRVAAGWVLGHASGVVQGDKALALCGFAGMGKSTLALHLVARGLDFLSNDRVLVEPAAHAENGTPVLHGIPKHPRLNPGTALGNPELAPLLSCALPASFRAVYADMPAEALFGVEDKYDAIIDDCFGVETSLEGAKRSRFRLAAPLAGVVVLNWRHTAGPGEPMRAARVDLAQRPDLLEALRKPPGAFYLPGALETARLTAADCLRALSGVPALELCGGSHFAAGTAACLEFLDH